MLLNFNISTHRGLFVLSVPKQKNLVELLNDYYVGRNSKAYSSKGKVRNLKEFNEIWNFLQNKNILSVDEFKLKQAPTHLESECFNQIFKESFSD